MHGGRCWRQHRCTVYMTTHPTPHLRPKVCTCRAALQAAQNEGDKEDAACGAFVCSSTQEGTSILRYGTSSHASHVTSPDTPLLSYFATTTPPLYSNTPLISTSSSRSFWSTSPERREGPHARDRTRSYKRYDTRLLKLNATMIETTIFELLYLVS